MSWPKYTREATSIFRSNCQNLVVNDCWCVPLATRPLSAGRWALRLVSLWSLAPVRLFQPRRLRYKEEFLRISITPGSRHVDERRYLIGRGQRLCVPKIQTTAHRSLPSKQAISISRKDS